MPYIEDAAEQSPECVDTRILTPCFSQQGVAYLPKSRDFLTLLYKHVGGNPYFEKFETDGFGR